MGGVSLITIDPEDSDALSWNIFWVHSHCTPVHDIHVCLRPCMHVGMLGVSYAI